MRCPYCGSESRVVDSRPLPDGIRRRRECSSCDRRFTTHERLAVAEIRVLKARGRGTEEFQSLKIVRALTRVCRGRIVPSETIAQAARKIEIELLDRGMVSVRSREIASMVMKELAEIDSVAFERFAVNYQDEDLALPETKAKREAPSQYRLFEEPS
jgi:transcriptional repressor NrdR